jgi:hypothetical protein
MVNYIVHLFLYFSVMSVWSVVIAHFQIAKLCLLLFYFFSTWAASESSVGQYFQRSSICATNFPTSSVHFLFFIFIGVPSYFNSLFFFFTNLESNMFCFRCNLDSWCYIFFSKIRLKAVNFPLCPFFTWLSYILIFLKFFIQFIFCNPLCFPLIHWDYLEMYNLISQIWGFPN